MQQNAIIRNLRDIEPMTSESPRGRFLVHRHNLSRALGAQRNSGPWNGGPPFDIEQVMLPAGKANYLFHSHQTAWEFYWIFSGRGSVRLGNEIKQITAGDFFICPPGCAHPINAETDITYAVIANNVPTDICFCPDSQKWIALPDRICFREKLDYFDGEES